MNDKIKLLGEPEQPQQPSFPFVNVQVAPQGLVITTHFTPVSAFTQMLDKETLKKVLPQLKDMLRQEQTELELIRHINNSKVN